VVGRAGRAEKPGTVVLQTGQPTHYAIQAVARGDYAGFARQEIGLRGELSYPLSSTLIRVVFIGGSDEAVRKSAESAARALRQGLSASEEVLGPAPGVHAKLKGRFRHHLLLKVKDRARMEAVVEALRAVRPASAVKMKVDIDPYDFF
jgi:primosomal protein N' (replication factor Y) (superfamily II helicase)